MTARGLWCRIAFATTAAAVLALTLSPQRPSARVTPMLAVLGGGAAGVALFGLATKRLPRNPMQIAPFTQAVVGLCAANEEVFWRRVALGEALPLGAAVALTTSTVAFALAHRKSRRLHLATGGTFGVLYLGTGSLVTSIAAHWAYNACVGSLAKQAPP